MNAKTPRIVLQAGILMAPLALVACGGGGAAVCDNPNPAVCAAVSSAVVGSPPAVATLFTNAPTAVTLNAGASAAYSVGGGTPPYSATSGNTGVGKASISGTTLSITSVAAGTAPVVVVDSLGKTINIALTVIAQGQAGTALSLAPAALTIGDCTTNVPFIFTGGTPPYTVFSSDNFRVPVSSPLDLILGKSSYFTATIHYGTSAASTTPATDTVNPFPPATLTVLDSQSRTATVTVTTPVIHNPCPSNPLLKIFPESANFRASEILSFQITGGPPPATPPISPIPTVTILDSTIATIVDVSTTAVKVQANHPGTTLMTIESTDRQRASVIVTVLPQP